MSVLIKMAMPQNCRECRLAEIVNRHGRERYICIAHLNEITNLKERLETCPLIELPDHGDLIDRDAIRKGWRLSDSCNRCERVPYQCHYHEEMSIMDVCGMLDDAPVVIPAERSEDAHNPTD